MKKAITLSLLLVAVSAAYWMVRAGELEPPGPPAPTMKTLDEVEPRIPIRADDLPLTIFSSGSYYFAEDISAAGAGITISADNVTIDLMGFSLQGGEGRFTGIRATTGTKNLEVRNGTVSGWEGRGIDLQLAPNSLVRDVRAEGNTGDGIRVGTDSSVIGCVARNNGGHGISISGGGGTVSGCTAVSNIASGISVGEGSTVTACTANDNAIHGIIANGHATVTGSTAHSNDIDGIVVSLGGTVTGCTATANGDDGIFASVARVEGNLVSSNTGDGIVVSVDSSVVGNDCVGNDAGIHATGSDNRIEANNVTDNNRGLDVDQGGNIIIKNTASGNGQNYANVVAGNAFGAVVTTSTTISSTNPWANFSF